MKAVRNIDKHDFEIPFNFNTYSLPRAKMVIVPDDLYFFLAERFPMSFEFDVEPKGKLSQVKSVKSKAFIKTEEPKLDELDHFTETSSPNPTFGGADMTPPGGTLDKDGVQWFGEGIEIEGGQNVS